MYDETRRSFVAHLPRPFSKEACATFYSIVDGGTLWSNPKGPVGIAIPRKTAWMVSAERGCACKYRYGCVEVGPQRYPHWMVSLMQCVMPYCGIFAEQDWPNSCNLNLYEDGEMSVAWHSDDEQLFQGKFRDCRIISLSFGATRSFEVRKNWANGNKEKPMYKLSLEDGDLCTMEGMCQKHAQHRVPREEGVKGPRINLTWRWLVKHDVRCPARRCGG